MDCTVEFFVMSLEEHFERFNELYERSEPSACIGLFSFETFDKNESFLFFHIDMYYKQSGYSSISCFPVYLENVREFFHYLETVDKDEDLILNGFEYYDSMNEGKECIVCGGGTKDESCFGFSAMRSIETVAGVPSGLTYYLHSKCASEFVREAETVLTDSSFVRDNI